MDQRLFIILAILGLAAATSSRNVSIGYFDPKFRQLTTNETRMGPADIKIPDECDKPYMVHIGSDISVVSDDDDVQVNFYSRNEAKITSSPLARNIVSAYISCVPLLS